MYQKLEEEVNLNDITSISESKNPLDLLADEVSQFLIKNPPFGLDPSDVADWSGVSPDFNGSFDDELTLAENIMVFCNEHNITPPDDLMKMVSAINIADSIKSLLENGSDEDEEVCGDSDCIVHKTSKETDLKLVMKLAELSFRVGDANTNSEACDIAKQMSMEVLQHIGEMRDHIDECLEVIEHLMDSPKGIQKH